MLSLISENAYFQMVFDQCNLNIKTCLAQLTSSERVKTELTFTAHMKTELTTFVHVKTKLKTVAYIIHQQKIDLAGFKIIIITLINKTHTTEPVSN